MGGTSVTPDPQQGTQPRIEKNILGKQASILSLTEVFLKYATLSILAVGLVVFLTYQYRSISHPYPLDYGEAAVLDQSIGMSWGENIYRTNLDSPPYTVSNYPPVYIAALVPFVKLFGPSFIFGRILSILCALIAAVCVYRILWTYEHDAFSAMVGGLLTLSMPFIVHWASLLRIDLLALGLSLTGLTLLNRWPLSTGRICVGAAFLVAAIFTRQTYALPAPMAAFFCVWSKDYKKAFFLAAMVTGCTLLAFIILNGLTDGGFYYSVFQANLQPILWSRTIAKVTYLREVLNLFVVIVIIYIVSQRKHPSWNLITAYIIGAVITALTVGKLGSNVNYFLELCVALSLATGMMLAWSRHQPNQLLRCLILLLIAVQSALCVHHTAVRYFPQLEARTSRIDELRKLESLVVNTKGPILADEYAGMLTIHGRRLFIEPFIAAQMAHEKRWDPANFIDGISRQEYDLILIHFFEFQPLYKERWTPAMLSAIEKNYVAQEWYADTRVYRPKSPENPTTR